MAASDRKRQKIIVIGAGPVGTLAAIYAAQRGGDVEIYELRSGTKSLSITPLLLEVACPSTSDSSMLHKTCGRHVESLHSAVARDSAMIKLLS